MSCHPNSHFATVCLRVGALPGVFFLNLHTDFNDCLLKPRPVTCPFPLQIIAFGGLMAPGRIHCLSKGILSKNQVIKKAQHFSGCLQEICLGNS